MDTLISVLLYINAIVPNGHYTLNDINNYAVIYAAPISQVEMNPPLFDAVLAEEKPLAKWVLDNLGG